MNKIKRALTVLIAVIIVISSGSVSLASTTMKNTFIHYEDGEITLLPDFLVVNMTPPNVTAGKSGTISIGIKNIGLGPANHMRVQPDTATLNPKIKVEQQYFAPLDTTLHMNSTETFELPVTVDKDLEPGTYPLNVIISYSNGNLSTSKTVLVTIKVLEGEKEKSLVTVASATVSNNQPKAGEDISFSFKISNLEGSTIKNLKVWIEGLDATKFSLKDNKPVQTMSQLANGLSNTFTFNYFINSSTPSGGYSYKLIYEYTNANDNVVTKEISYNIFIEPKANLNSEVAISDIVYPNSVKQDAVFNVSFNIANKGAAEIKNVKIQLSDNQFILPKTSSVISISKLAGGASQKVSFDLVGTGEGMVSRNYPVIFTVTYDVEQNGEVKNQSIQQSIGVYVEAKEQVEETDSVPKIIVDQYESDPMIITAGSEFTLNLSFLNTHSYKTVKNIKIFLTSNDATNESGNVFTPVDSSNTFYIDEIRPKQSAQKSIKLFTVPDASPRTYTIKVNFEYEDEKGNVYTPVELVGIHVKQPTKIEVSSFTVPEMCMAGEPIMVYFDIYNTGKAKAYNVMVKVEGDITADPQSYFVGNFEPGSMDYYEGMIYAYTPGFATGKIIISYDDPSGEHFEIVHDVNIEVMEYTMPEYDDVFDPIEGGDMEPVEKKPPYILIGVGAGVLLVAVIVIIIIVKKRKAKKEGMMDDEI